MKNIKPLLAFITCLWAVVVITYAKQVEYDQHAPDGKGISKSTLMYTPTSCSSSSNSSGE